ncbi:hypothetical protein [Psychroflexus halocasei]|uniref:Uncharacterized protein n=1 Tax=Psychroflexus halocasei TaxID=908615 RepID=A0A1H3ZQ22_9FLAO|nr:hypothetical protein [Psychroflexus halocasei]SEA25873.1 hypothetical protein SAMN05421540_104169 [Psychroflexus halocasei]
MGDKKEMVNHLETNDIFRELKKDTLFRFHELYYSLRIINDGIKLFDDGSHYQLNVICGQLRSLFFENSSGLKPLLIEIINLVDKKPFIYAKETEAERFVTINKLNLYLINSSINHQKDYRKYTLDEFLQLSAVTLNEIKLPLSKVVSKYSNTFGGSHYSDKIPKYIIQLMSIKFNGLNSIEYVIAKQTRTLYNYGYEVLRSTIDLDFFINLKLKENNSGEDLSIINYLLTITAFQLIFLQIISLTW